MPERSRKEKGEKRKDLNEIAAGIVGQATGGEEPEEEQPEKNAAAVELGRRGGLKGGPARAEKLSKERRAEIAKKAAEARWGPKKP